MFLPTRPMKEYEVTESDEYLAERNREWALWARTGGGRTVPEWRPAQNLVGPNGEERWVPGYAVLKDAPPPPPIYEIGDPVNLNSGWLKYKILDCRYSGRNGYWEYQLLTGSTLNWYRETSLRCAKYSDVPQPKVQPPLPAKETILQEAHRLITGERNKTYGKAIDDYTRVGKVFCALTGINLTPAQCVMFMVVLKQCRLVVNLEKQLWHRDSAVDVGGYLGCLETVVKALQEVDKPLWDMAQGFTENKEEIVWKAD